MHAPFLLLTDRPPVMALPRLSARARVLYTGDTPFRWKGYTWFLGGQRITRGESVADQLAYIKGEGFNLVRIFAAMKIVPEQRGLPAFMLSNAELQTVLQAVTRAGLYAEVTVGDMQLLMPDPTQQRAYLDSLEAGTHPRETCNEPFKNGVDVAQMGRIDTAFHASGNYRRTAEVQGNTVIERWPAVLDYVTNHSERKPEWPRTPHFAEEAWDGWDIPASQNTSGPYKGKRLVFAGVRVPFIEDEPTGAAEVAEGNSRSNVPADFFDYAACAGLFCAGATFHSSDGISAVMPGPIQRECAKQFSAGLDAIPVQAPDWEYTRGGSSRCPIAHVDLEDDPARGALRTYAKFTGTFAVVLAIRPGPQWRAVPANGWRFISQTGDRGNVVYLERS